MRTVGRRRDQHSAGYLPRGAERIPCAKHTDSKNIQRGLGALEAARMARESNSLSTFASSEVVQMLHVIRDKVDHADVQKDKRGRIEALTLYLLEAKWTAEMTATFAWNIGMSGGRATGYGFIDGLHVLRIGWENPPWESGHD